MSVSNSLYSTNCLLKFFLSVYIECDLVLSYHNRV
nr:MAG TPA: hypothetical protein [Caudoviricetes sp.]